MFEFETKFIFNDSVKKKSKSWDQASTNDARFKYLLKHEHRSGMSFSQIEAYHIKKNFTLAKVK
jgi:hypothetical protein